MNKSRSDTDIIANFFVLTSGVLWAAQPAFLLLSARIFADLSESVTVMNVLGTFACAAILALFFTNFSPFSRLLKDRRRLLNVIWRIVLDGFFVALSYRILVESGKSLNLASAAVFFEAWPVFLAVLLLIFGAKQNQSSVNAIFSSALFVFGYFILNLTELSDFMALGGAGLFLTVLPTLSGVAMAVAVFIVQILVRKEAELFDSFGGMFVLIASRALCTSIFLFAFGGVGWNGFASGGGIVAIVALGFGAIVTMSSVFFHLGSARASSNASSLLALVSPVLAPVFLFFAGQGVFDVNFKIGAAVIVAAIAFTARNENNSRYFQVLLAGLVAFGSAIALLPGKGADSYFDYLGVVAVVFGLLQASLIARVWQKRDDLGKLNAAWIGLKGHGVPLSERCSRRVTLMAEIRELKGSVATNSEAVLLTVVSAVNIFVSIFLRPPGVTADIIAYLVSVTTFFLLAQIWAMQIEILRYVPRNVARLRRMKFDFQSKLFSYLVLVFLFFWFAFAIAA